MGATTASKLSQQSEYELEEDEEYYVTYHRCHRRYAPDGSAVCNVECL